MFGTLQSCTYIYIVFKTTKHSNIMEKALITQSNPQQIESITIELDEWDSYNVKDHEVGYGDDYLQFDLTVYQSVEYIRGNHLIPDNHKVTNTIISIENLKMTDPDGEVILLTDERKRSIEGEITNAITIG